VTGELGGEGTVAGDANDDAGAMQSDWARLEAMTPEETLRNALADPDAQPLTPELRARLRRVPNPRAIRERMGLTQKEFARRFEIALGTVQGWEEGTWIPDSTAKAYLRVIEQNPGAVIAALEESYAHPDG
jgi:putative transcriptional regulator